MARKEYTVEQRGTGKPDFTEDVSSGIQKRGYRLKSNQKALIFLRTFSEVDSDASWVTAAPLAPGETAHLINVEDGEEMPYTCPAGYTLTVTELMHGGSEDVLSEFYYEPAPGLGLQLVINVVLVAGIFSYEQALAALSTETLDPPAAYAHEIDMRFTNLGTDGLTGQETALAILTPVGTKPLPIIKDVKCKHCGNKQTVPIETTTVICPVCGKLTIYYSLAKYRGS